MGIKRSQQVVMVVGAAALFLGGCGKKKSTDSSTSATRAIPEVAPLVAASLSAGLKPGAVAPVTPSEFQRLMGQAHTKDQGIHVMSNTNATLAAAYITNLFQDEFAASTGNVQGLVNAQVTTVDDRMSLFKDASTTTGCLANTAKPITLNLAAIDSTLKVTLDQVQCYSPFGNKTIDQTNAGEAFGQSGTSASLWVQASDDVATTGTAGATWANVKNVGSTSTDKPVTVDGLSVIYTPNTSANHGGEMLFARFVAVPTTKTFELFAASSGGLVDGMPGSKDSYIGAGIRVITNGTYVYADGRICTSTAVGGCVGSTNWAAFDACLDGTSLEVHTPATDCATLASSFTLGTSATLTYESITGEANLTNIGGTIGPSDANAALLLPFLKISAFSEVGTKY